MSISLRCEIPNPRTAARLTKKQLTAEPDANDRATTSASPKCDAPAQVGQGCQQTRPCQQEKPENSQAKTWGSASTLRLRPKARTASLPTGENRRLTKTCAMLRIRARRPPRAHVKKTTVGSWGGTVLAPRHGFEPRFTAPKAAVLPLDDRGSVRLQLRSDP